MNLRELRAKLAEKLNSMKALNAKAKAEVRALSADEKQTYDELDADAQALEAKIAELEAEEERRNELNARLARLVGSGSGRQVPPDDPNIGMNADERKRYSLTRAIRAAVSGDWSQAGLEREASEAVAQRSGREPQSFFVPNDVLVGEKRDMTVGTDADGGYLKGTELLGGSFIDYLANKMFVRSAGATLMTGLVGDVAIPSKTATGTGYWVAESGAPTESKPTLDQVALSPKTVGAFTDISRKLLKQSTPAADMLVQDDLSLVLALAIDLAALHGTGTSNQPTGIAATTGIGTVVGGTNGAAPTWADIVALETEVSVDNADIGRLAYMTNAKVRGKLKSTAIGTDQRMVWGDGNTPLNGYPAYVTSQVSSTLTKGTSSGVCSAIFFGNWADLIIGMWGGLDILVDPYTGSSSGTVRVTAFQDVDIVVRHAASFAAMLDALTA